MIESDIFDFQNYNPRYYAYIDSARKLFSDYKPLAFNLCVYKAHLYFRHLLDNVSEFKNLESEVKMYEKDSMIDQTILHHVLYNYYLTGSIYYKELHLYPDMYRCFDKVKPLLSLASLNKKEVYDVGKYFNYFFRFGETIDLLEEYENKYPNDKDLTFLYVSTAAIYNTNLNYHMQEFEKQLDKLAKLDRQKLCTWINENYQLIRDPDLEKKLCTYCHISSY